MTSMSKPLFEIVEFNPDNRVELTRETRRYVIPRIRQIIKYYVPEFDDNGIKKEDGKEIYHFK